MKKQNKAATLVTAMVVITIMSAIAVLGSIYAITNRNEERVIRLPTISTTLQSQSGSRHTVEARIDVVLNNNANRVDSRELTEMVNDIFRRLDYDRLTELDGLDYVRREITNGIADFVGGTDVATIFFSDFINDGQLESDPNRNFNNNPFGWTR
jgi:flagellar basal body-associated protein FliL